MSDPKLLLVGGGGHCKSVIDALLSANTFKNIAIIDKASLVGTKVLGIPVIGTDDDLKKYYNQGYHHAFISVGSTGNTALRRNLYKLIKSIGFILPNIIDQSAIVSNFSTLSEGIFIGKNATINANSTINACAIINSCATIEHDCIINPFVHIAPSATLGGHVVIEDDTHIGLNATIKQSIHIGSNTIIGMGSVVTHDIANNLVAYGNPCKIIT